MKKLFLLFIPLFFILGCTNNSDEPSEQNKGPETEKTNTPEDESPKTSVVILYAAGLDSVHYEFLDEEAEIYKQGVVSRTDNSIKINHFLNGRYRLKAYPTRIPTHQHTEYITISQDCKIAFYANGTFAVEY